MMGSNERDRLEARRLRAMRLLQRGMPQAEVARRLDVSRQSVSRWNKRLESSGPSALKAGLRGRPPRLTDVDRRSLARLLQAGAKAAGFEGDAWTLPRISALIEACFGCQLSRSGVSRLLKQLGWQQRRARSPSSLAR